VAEADGEFGWEAGARDRCGGIWLGRVLVLVLVLVAVALGHIVYSCRAGTTGPGAMGLDWVETDRFAGVCRSVPCRAGVEGSVGRNSRCRWTDGEWLVPSCGRFLCFSATKRPCRGTSAYPGHGVEALERGNASWPTCSVV
jgi:hypothetical protein